MENKKVGGALIVLSLLVGVFVFSMISQFNTHATQMNCDQNSQCASIGSALNWSHFGFGLIAAVFSLGIYLLFFSRSEHLLRQAIKRLESEKQRLEQEHSVKIADEKFNAILRTLSDSEQSVLKIIKEQEGITQNTLRVKANLSKAKLSQMLSEFNKRGMVKREAKGKTYALYIGLF